MERDIDQSEALQGYILTERSHHALQRIIIDSTFFHRTNAYTITSIYGTGKSAFAHFLTSLVAPETHPTRQQALDTCRGVLSTADYHSLIENLPKQGFLRAIATAGHEALGYTVVRALLRGANNFWQKGKKQPEIVKKLVDLEIELATGEKVDNQRILKIVVEVIKTAQTPALLLIDELGKNLEFSALHSGTEDLYLLQQLAELKTPQAFYLVGLLHQSFADYGDRLATVQRNEWSKIQGRFEDIAFVDRPRQMTKLIGQAIVPLQTVATELNENPEYDSLIQLQAADWYHKLSTDFDDLSPELIAAVYPLHPITALVLPVLCTRYGQSDRSLFTFLTSTEPYSFQSYLNTTEIIPDLLPTLKLDQLYDYFIAAVGTGFAARPQLRKWLEIHDLISNMTSLTATETALLKTIGILNLVDGNGELKASLELVKLAMSDQANDIHQQEQIANLIDEFHAGKGIINYRKQANELRLWEGTDFDIEAEISNLISQERSPLATNLTASFPLPPVIAQRHSYQIGAVRYFERCYLDNAEDWSKLSCSNSGYDGLIGYWVGEDLPQNVPVMTTDGKPLIILKAENLNLLQIAAVEYRALQKLQDRPELDQDMVARREVRFRLVQAERSLDERLSQAFSFQQCDCWLLGERVIIRNPLDFQTQLSAVCDRIYDRSLILWNELINRRQLTAQGVKAMRLLIEAMRLLIEAMLERGDVEDLGLQGQGPEVSIYISVLKNTGIHRQEDGVWGFYPPTETGIIATWQAIEDFCLAATQKLATLDRLYTQLELPPYGVKRGVVPVLLAAVLLYRLEDVSVYKDGTFIPVLGSEHFELLVKQPQRFAVKHFEIVGLRSQVFRELETILRHPHAKIPTGIRNATILSVAKPLFQFVKKLPTYTTKTKQISPEAQAVIQALLTAQEPDDLIFTALPVACSLEAIGISEDADQDLFIARTFQEKLRGVLIEIQSTYDRLLTDCRGLLHNAFGLRSEDKKLRSDFTIYHQH